MAPEVVLLFKAKHEQPKDRQDLDVAVPMMERARVTWLVDALAIVHPDHDWLELLRAR